MDITKSNKLFFGPDTWLYLAGTDECGSEIHHEAYCVLAEDEKEIVGLIIILLDFQILLKKLKEIHLKVGNFLSLLLKSFAIK